jgi:hypothetical protein
MVHAENSDAYMQHLRERLRTEFGAESEEEDISDNEEDETSIELDQAANKSGVSKEALAVFLPYNPFMDAPRNQNQDIGLVAQVHAARAKLTTARSNLETVLKRMQKLRETLGATNVYFALFPVAGYTPKGQEPATVSKIQKAHAAYIADKQESENTRGIIAQQRSILSRLETQWVVTMESAIQQAANRREFDSVMMFNPLQEPLTPITAEEQRQADAYAQHHYAMAVFSGTRKATEKVTDYYSDAFSIRKTRWALHINTPIRDAALREMYAHEHVLTQLAVKLRLKEQHLSFKNADIGMDAARKIQSDWDAMLASEPDRLSPEERARVQSAYNDVLKKWREARVRYDDAVFWITSSTQILQTEAAYWSNTQRMLQRKQIALYKADVQAAHLLRTQARMTIQKYKSAANAPVPGEKSILSVEAREVRAEQKAAAQRWVQRAQELETAMSNVIERKSPKLGPPGTDYIVV